MKRMGKSVVIDFYLLLSQSPGNPEEIRSQIRKGAP